MARDTDQLDLAIKEALARFDGQQRIAMYRCSVSVALDISRHKLHLVKSRGNSLKFSAVSRALARLRKGGSIEYSRSTGWRLA